MRNWPRYSRGSFEAEEITRPPRKKIFFSTRLLLMTRVPVFCPRLSHWRRSPGSIVLRLPERAMRKAANYKRALTSRRPKQKRRPRGPPLHFFVRELEVNERAGFSRSTA